MEDKDKTKVQLIDELAKLRKRVTELEKSKPEHNKAKKNIAEDESILSKAEGVGRMGSWKLDPTTFQITWSKGMYKIFGFNKRTKANLERGSKLIHPDDFERAWTYSGDAVKAQIPYDLEYRILRVDGEERIIYTKGEPIFDAEGNLRHYIGIVQDITERKKAEEELENIFNLSPEMIGVFTTEGGLLKVNLSWEKVLGYTQKELLDMDWNKLIHPDDVEKTNKEGEKQLKGKDVVNFVNRYKCKDGSYKTLEWQATFSKDGIVYATARDISERKKVEKIQTSIFDISEAALSAKNLERLYHSIHNIIGKLMPAKNNFYIALYEKDSEMLTFPYFVDKYEKNPGTQMLGKGLTEYVLRTEKSLLASPEVFDKLEKKGEVVSVGPPSIDWLGVPLKIQDKTIGVLVVQSYTKGIRYSEEDKNILVFISNQIAMVIDRMRAEEELQKLASVVHYSSELVNLATIDGKMIFLNEAGSKMLGIDPKAVEKHKIMEVIPEHLVDMVTIELLPALIKHGKWEGDLQYRNIKTGELTDVQAMCFTVKDPTTGTPKYFANVSLDMTERKQAEEELLSSKKELQKLAAHMQVATEQERGLIASELHDEVGQALTGLKMDLFMMKNKISKDQKEIPSEFQRMENLLDDTIGKLRKIYSDLRPNLLEHFGVGEAMSQHCKDFQEQSGIKCTYFQNPEEIILDENRSIALYRIMQGAINNIKWHSRATKVNIRLVERGLNLKLTIKDNGKGIEEEQIRSSDSFGLIGMRERARYLGGELKITGIPDKGTTVKLSIPLNPKNH